MKEARSLWPPSLPRRTPHLTKPDGIRAVAEKGDRNMRERGSRTKRDPIPVTENLDHPGIGSPRLPNLPMRRETPHYLARRGTWLLSPKTLVGRFQSGRRSRRVKPDPLGEAKGRARLSATATRRRTSRAKTAMPRPRAVGGHIH